MSLSARSAQPVLRTEEFFKVGGTVPLGIQTADDCTDTRSCNIVDRNVGTFYFLQHAYGSSAFRTAAAKDQPHPGTGLPGLFLLLCLHRQRTESQHQKHEKSFLHDSKITVFLRKNGDFSAFSCCDGRCGGNGRNPGKTGRSFRKKHRAVPGFVFTQHERLEHLFFHSPSSCSPILS